MIAEELWRVSLLKYYSQDGKHSSAHTSDHEPSHILQVDFQPQCVCVCASSEVLEWPFWTKLIVVAIGFIGGLIFMYIQCKVYLQLWRRLKAFNRIITVQNCPEKGVHNSQSWPSALTNGRQETVEVPVSPAPVPAPGAQMDSDVSVEAAVAPAQNPN